MTIEEFRARMNAGPTAEELKAGFEARIVELVNKTVDEREDIREIKDKVREYEETIKRLQTALNTLTGMVPPDPSKK